MSDFYNAFEISPVPEPADDAVPPEPYRGIYGMPMFVTVPTPDLPASQQFWTDGLGFIDLFSVPGQIVHLRRWAFQDVLLVPAQETSRNDSSRQDTVTTVSFACVQSQLAQVAAACEELRPGCTSGPHQMPWNTTDLQIRTPEGACVVYTAARPFDPDSAQARTLNEMGIVHPDQ